MASTTLKEENCSDGLLACRICLASDVKLFHIQDCSLDQVFKDVIGITVFACDVFPKHVCVFCRALLLRGRELRARCQRARRLLEDALYHEHSITTSYIRSIDRKLHNLAHTFSENYSSDVKDIKHEDTQKGTKLDINPENDIENYVKDYDTDVTYDDDDVNDDGSGTNSDFKPKIAYIKLDGVVVPQNTPKVNIVESVHQTVKQDLNTPQVNVTGCIDKTVKKDTESCKRKFPEINLTDSNYKTVRKDIKSCKRKFPEINVTECNDEAMKKDVKCCKRKLVRKKTETKQTKEKKGQNWRKKPFSKEEGFKEFEEKYCFKIISVSEEDMVKAMEARKDSYNYKFSAFKCEFCFKGFLSQNTFDNHMKIHDPSRSMECRLCHNRYFRSGSLRDHLRDNHELKFQCLRCEETINSKYCAQMHAQFHAGRTFKCDHCDQQFLKSTTCNTHMRMSHPREKAEGATCSICGETFLSAAGLKAHKARSHWSLLPSHRCRKCKVRFDTSDAIERHRRTQPGGKCDTKHSSCTQCGEAYANEQGLLTHRKEQHGLQLFTCDMCGKTFESKESVATHIDRVHRLLRPPAPARPGFRQRPRRRAAAPRAPVCEHCGKRVSCMATLKIHMNKHTGERPYKCNLCPKSYISPQGLKKHEPVHTGVHKWRCDDCGAAFIYQASLSVHRKTVHSAEKAYKCHICSNTFTQSGSLYTHVKYVHMKSHEPVHSGARKWSCEECHATFMRQSSLSLHRRAVHSGERAHQCHICSKTFTQSGSLYTHVKYVHMKVKPPPRKRNKKTAA